MVHSAAQKIATLQIKQKLKKLIESGMIHGVTQTQLSTELGVTRGAINKYMQELKKNIKDEDVRSVYIDFKVLFDRLFRECYSMLQSSKKAEDKRKTIILISQLIKDKTQLLENFFIKQKASEIITEVTAIRVIVDEGKKEKVVDIEQ